MKFSIGQWAYSILGAWWALMLMPFLGLMIAAASSYDAGVPLEAALLDPAVWVFPFVFAVVGAGFCALMVLLLWLTRTHPLAAAGFSLAMTGAAVARYSYLRHEERLDREEHAWEPSWEDHPTYPVPSHYPQSTTLPPALRLEDPFSPPPNWNRSSFSPIHGQMSHDCTPACGWYQWT